MYSGFGTARPRARIRGSPGRDRGPDGRDGSVHGYEYWYALKNPQHGATELLVKGPGDWNVPLESRLTERLPLEAVLASARRVPYDMATRANYARVAEMVLTDRLDGAGRVELQFYRATTVLAAHPVNALIDELDRAVHHMLLMKPTAP